jgi:hypothetical protein
MDTKITFEQDLAIDRFIYAVETGYYVEAHELLEDDWNLYKKQGQREKALVLKGLINGATALALYHVKNKPAGHAKVWPAFLKYIPLLDEVDLENKDRFYFAKKLLMDRNDLIA